MDTEDRKRSTELESPRVGTGVDLGVLGESSGRTPYVATSPLCTVQWQ